MFIIGISAFYHDSAVCLIKNGEIISAISEERLTRIKQDKAFPEKSLKFILKENNLNISDISTFVFYEKPFLKFERLLENYLQEAPFGFFSFLKAMPVWLKEKLFLKKILKQKLEKIGKISLSKIKFSEHHFSHSASAFFPSPFEKSAILTLDGVGEIKSTSISIGNENKIKNLKEMNYPHSIGLFYSALTYFLGFKVNSGEYKVMGLAPYGKPIFYEKMKNQLMDLKEDGSFRLNLKYFCFTKKLQMTDKNLEKFFEIKARKGEKKLEQIHMDIASSLQKLTEEIVLRIVKYTKKITGEKNLCLAGGVALNCVANGKILKENIFENIWIQPASGDSGGSIGASLGYFYQELGNKRAVLKEDSMKGAYLGPKSSEKEILEMAEKFGANYEKISDEKILIEKIGNFLKKGKILGIHQGKMEFGPRSLGNRSIIGDARNPEMQKNMNLKIKFRESFRPFAPAVLEEDLEKYFDIKVKSPYMLLVGNVLEKLRKKTSGKNFFGIEKLNEIRSEIPAITHIDFSARIQTVSSKTNPFFHKIISKFKEKTGCSVLVNTSFNVRGEPIVCSPEDSYKCFMRTEIDVLVIENYLFLKEKQKDFEDLEKWKEKFVLD